MKKSILVFAIIIAFISACNTDEDDFIPSEKTKEEPEKHIDPSAEKALQLSHNFGIYSAPFRLVIEKADANDVVYYTTDGSEATTKSTIFPDEGIVIKHSATASDFVLTPKVLNYNSWEQYNYGYVDKGVSISLLELTQDGDTLAQKRGTYIVNATLAHSTIPIVCLSAPITDWLGTDFSGGLYNTYPDIDSDKKYRCWLEFYDQESNSSFALNSQMKRGGNWTRSYPCRTINLNFNKDENGNKNELPSVDLFAGHERIDGSGQLVGDVSRFRLHSGGNACFGTLISDAFVHQLIGNKTAVATTAWRPCMLYLNAEYWGLYQMREHYSDAYFKNNFGVKKSDVQYVDKVYSGSFSNKAYTRYSFDIKEGNEDEVLAELDSLFLFLGYDYKKAPTTLAKDWDTSGWELIGDDTKYAEFCKRVDVESLIDMVLIQGYCSNWDFMYNNLRMWRTRNVDPSNPYADGRWRFCLQDVDFAFEDATADNVLKADDGTEGDGLWNTHQISLFDYYVGNAYLNTGSVLGYLKPYNYLLLYLPMQNPEFKALVKERAEYIQQLFDVSNCEALWNDMIAQIEPYIADRATRWGHQWWNYYSWQNDLNYRLWRIQNRSTYFMPQVKKTFGF